jgi:hypothetical protein
MIIGAATEVPRNSGHPPAGMMAGLTETDKQLQERIHVLLKELF